MSHSLVTDIRRFNRFYTRTIGLLNETLTKSAYTLTEARVLFELGAGQTAASDIAAALLLDPSYLARLLDKFRKAGLLEASASAEDGRRKTLTLTDKGRSELAVLQSAAEDEVSALVGTIGGEDRRQLSVAMATIESVLSSTQNDDPVELRPLAIGDVGWVIERQAKLYADEYGWNGEFEAMLAEIGAAFIRNYRPGRDFCWVAVRGNERLGAAFLVGREDGDGQLRMLHVERHARGHGVGSRLVGECIETARRVGYPRLSLWTNDILVGARRIYERAGFTLSTEDRHHSFGKDLVGQTWDLRL